MILLLLLRSCCRYLSTLVVVILAVLIGWIVKTGHQTTSGVDLRHQNSVHQQHPRFASAAGGDDDATTTTPFYTVRSLTSTEIADYHRDGTVLVRQLLTKQQTKLLQQGIVHAPTLNGTIFDLISNRLFDRIQFDTWRSDVTVASFALLGLPKIAASVFVFPPPPPEVTTTATTTTNTNTRPPPPPNNDDDDDASLRLLRDAYFSYAPGGRGCGWHVDDEAFWPTMNDTSGVTIWIALDDMMGSSGGGGGGLMVANRTAFFDNPHLLPECRAKTRSATCDMERVAPECHEQLERAAIRSWNSLQAGDAIVWDRWVFHRTVPTSTTNNNNNTNSKDDTSDGSSSSSSSSTTSSLLRRYSVRYIPSNAKPFGAIHASVQQHGTFVGSPYYPQVWPTLIADELEALRNGLEADVSLLNLGYNLVRFVYQQALDVIRFKTTRTNKDDQQQQQQQRP